MWLAWAILGFSTGCLVVALLMARNARNTYALAQSLIAAHIRSVLTEDEQRLRMVTNDDDAG